MTKLAAVRYRLFQGEESAADAAARDEVHEFGGELVLTFEHGRELFVSWVGEPVQYALGTKASSHFVSDADLTDFDVSGTAAWAGLIGQDVALHFTAHENQVLSVSSATGEVLLCSYGQGGWWADEVTVCKKAPAPHVA